VPGAQAHQALDIAVAVQPHAPTIVLHDQRSRLRPQIDPARMALLVLVDRVGEQRLGEPGEERHQAGAKCSAQAPGPSGWPQLPQGLIAAAAATSRGAEPPTRPTTESCLLSCVDWQCGHSGTVEDRTSVSKVRAHCRQAHSKMGMARTDGRSLHSPASRRWLAGLAEFDRIRSTQATTCVVATAA
jgi:hypothetical protein